MWSRDYLFISRPSHGLFNISRYGVDRRFAQRTIDSILVNRDLDYNYNYIQNSWIRITIGIQKFLKFADA